MTDAPNRVGTDANVWIALADGCRLAARIWRPATAEVDPVPAILEYLPYRKGDGTAARDESVASYFADHGYAYIRVDMRGTGDSDGIIEDEYAPAEQDDALEVITWIAEQPWCTGAVGMIGISWGGFNGLQIAARRPPELKAVISMCSTDDRYADDVHYLGGCLLGIEMLPWASYMLAINALPPDPRTVGDGWRSTWLERLDQTPPFIHRWMEHQRRDDYWKHGSVCEDYAAIECPVYMVGGWADGYTNAVPRFLEGHTGIRKGLIGPWPHAWPQHATPGPRIGFLQECLRWWDRWLKDKPNGIEDEPMLRVWMQEALTPMSARGDRPGRWITEDSWPPPNVTAARRYLTAAGLRDTSATPIELQHRGAQHHGLLSGAWCPYGPAADFPSDQRAEDALCMTFDSPPLDERIELLGRPRLGLEVSCDRTLGIVTARLCDVSPDGVSTLLSNGFLNLTHRDGHEELSPPVPEERYTVEIDLNVVGQAIPAGHRLRLAVSTTSWPLAWPSPEVTTLAVHTGEHSFLDLPVRVSHKEAEPAAFGPPEEAPPLATTTEESEPPYRRIVHDTVTDTYVLSINQGGNERVRLDGADLEMEVQLLDRWTIREGDPLSAEVFCERRMGRRRGDWDVAVETRSRMTADAETFLIDDSLEAFEDGRRVFARSWVRRVPRDHV